MAVPLINFRHCNVAVHRRHCSSTVHYVITCSTYAVDSFDRFVVFLSSATDRSWSYVYYEYSGYCKLLLRCQLLCLCVLSVVS